MFGLLIQRNPYTWNFDRTLEDNHYFVKLQRYNDDPNEDSELLGVMSPVGSLLPTLDKATALSILGCANDILSNLADTDKVIKVVTAINALVKSTSNYPDGTRNDDVVIDTLTEASRHILTYVEYINTAGVIDVMANRVMETHPAFGMGLHFMDDERSKELIGIKYVLASVLPLIGHVYKCFEARDAHTHEPVHALMHEMFIINRVVNKLFPKIFDYLVALTEKQPGAKGISRETIANLVSASYCTVILQAPYVVQGHPTNLAGMHQDFIRTALSKL